MSRVALSLAFWMFITLSSIALFPVAVVVWAVTAPFDRRKVILHQFTCFWASLYTWLNPVWPVRVDGARAASPRRTTYVMVANHQSLLDILVLFRLFRHFKWVSKIENFRVPCIGWNMSMNGYVKLRRGDTASIVAMMAACERRLAQGSSIMMFPEGTRSPTGRTAAPSSPAPSRSRSGTALPILPIVVEGTANALPKRGFVLQGRHPLSLTVLPPIPYETFAGIDATDLAERVRTILQDRVEPKEPTPAAP